MQKLDKKTGISLIQECFKNTFHPSYLIIENDSQRTFELTITPHPNNTTSPMINQDNIEFLIQKGFRITNIWSEPKGLRIVLYQVVQ